MARDHVGPTTVSVAMRIGRRVARPCDEDLISRRDRPSTVPSAGRTGLRIAHSVSPTAVVSQPSSVLQTGI